MISRLREKKIRLFDYAVIMSFILFGAKWGFIPMLVFLVVHYLLTSKLFKTLKPTAHFWAELLLNIGVVGMGVVSLVLNNNSLLIIMLFFVFGVIAFVVDLYNLDRFIR